jgi:hypothetical protein
MERASQWDIRLNVPTEEDVSQIITNIRLRYELDNVVYVHVSGVERSSTSGQRHVHIALILQNRTSENSIIRKYVVNPEHGFYVVPRDMKMDIDAWIAYHAKHATKIDPNIPFLYQAGKLPRKRVNVTEQERMERNVKQKSDKTTAWQRRHELVKKQD